MMDAGDCNFVPSVYSKTELQKKERSTEVANVESIAHLVLLSDLQCWTVYKAVIVSNVPNEDRWPKK